MDANNELSFKIHFFHKKDPCGDVILPEKYKTEMSFENFWKNLSLERRLRQFCLQLDFIVKDPIILFVTMGRCSTGVSEQLATIRNSCTKLLIETLTYSCNNIFELLDPLVSDNQCQMHSIFILNTLLKCYNYDECFYDVKCLQDDEIEILSDAILLTLLKTTHKDKFGLIIRQESLENFGGCLDSKKKESKFIAQIKENFNWKSVKFIKTIATKSVSKILSDCVAAIPRSNIKLKILPCYVTTYALLAYIKEKRLPIIVSMKKIELKGYPPDVKYKYNSMDVLYYKWNGKRFHCHENLNECEKNQPSITFESYSLCAFSPSNITYTSGYQKYIEKKDFPSKAFLMNCDISHLIMISMATHFQLSESRNMTLNKGYHNSDHYIHSTLKNFSTESLKQVYSVETQFDLNCTNIYEQYLAHVSLAQGCNSNDTKYSRLNSYTYVRSIKNVFFCPIHVHLSNYSNEYSKQLNFKSNVELDQEDVLRDINRDVSMYVLNKLGIINEDKFI